VDEKTNRGISPLKNYKEFVEQQPKGLGLAYELSPITGEAKSLADIPEYYEKTKEDLETGDYLDASGNAALYLLSALGTLPAIGIAPRALKSLAKNFSKKTTEGIGDAPISKEIQINETDAEKLIDEFGESKQPVTNLLKEPKKRKKAYKLFRQKKGKLYPLFVGKEEEIPVGQWVKAGVGEQTKTGKVKSSLGELAFRPGFHSGELPRAPHIGGKIDTETGQRTKKITKPNIREDNQVWAEVEVADDVDWQKIANERAAKKKDGTINVKTAHITDQLPSKGNYKYKTNPNMEDSWIISGEIKVNKILSDNEVKKINSKAGVEDLPRAKDIVKNIIKNKKGGSIIASNPYGNYDPRDI
jgi:hypothetical protein